MPHPSKIFIVDDHPIFRRGLAQLIDEEPELAVCGEAESVAEALRAVSRCAPDLVIVDLTLKDTSGLELIRRLHARQPELPLLVISMHDESVYAERVLRVGARGYITKQEMSGRVVDAIRRVLSGEIYASAPMMAHMVEKLVLGPEPAGGRPEEILSDRELEVFQLIGQGHSRQAIATMLGLSGKTVGTYKEHIKRKLHLANAAELTKHAVAWIGRAGDR